MIDSDGDARLDGLRKFRFTDIRRGGQLINGLTQKIDELDPHKFQDQLLEHQIRLLLDLLTEVLGDRYQDLSLLGFAHIIIALDYFMKTQDDIPDTQLAGYEDDLKVVQKVFTEFGNEIEAFKVWRSRQPKDDLY